MTTMKETRNWLHDSAMNLLVDYYPELQFRPYGTTCTLENTVPWLKQLDLGYLCIYAKGHGGYTTWKSALHTEHRMLGQDMPRFFREATRAAGSKLVLYYSGLLDGVTGVRHPDWRMLDVDGTPKNPFSTFKMDYFLCSGDFFSPGFFQLHEIAHMMRWYGTMGLPYDAYVCDTNYTHVRPGETSRTKPLDRMLQEAATVAANGGAVGYWTYPSGAGALTPSRMKKAAKVRAFLREREEVFLHTRSIGWTGIVATDPGIPTFGTPGIRGATKALAALHRSPDVMDETALAESGTGLPPRVPLDGHGLERPCHAITYDLLVLPEQTVVSDDTVKRLAAFVEAGGKLLTSGASIRSAALRKLLGIRSVREAELAEGHVIVPGFDEPTGIDAPWDRIELGEAVELDPLYRSWDAFNPECRGLHRSWPMHGQMDEEHPEPAGWPAATVRRLGNGIAIHIGTSIFARYYEVGDPQIRRWLARILDMLQPDPLFTTDCSRGSFQCASVR